MQHLLTALLTAVLMAGAASAAQQRRWLDQPLEPWNSAGAGLPASGAQPAADLLTRCTLLPAPSGPGHEAVAGTGWLPFLHQDRAVSRDDIVIVAGLAETTPTCAPARFHLFVFVGGRFAGTLSPTPMRTGSDGAAGAVRITGPESITAEFARYTPSDSECCPSSRVRVTYRIEREGAPVVHALGVQVVR